MKKWRGELPIEVQWLLCFDAASVEAAARGQKESGRGGEEMVWKPPGDERVEGQSFWPSITLLRSTAN